MLSNASLCTLTYKVVRLPSRVTEDDPRPHPASTGTAGHTPAICSGPTSAQSEKASPKLIERPERKDNRLSWYPPEYTTADGTSRSNRLLIVKRAIGLVEPLTDYNGK